MAYTLRGAGAAVCRVTPQWRVRWLVGVRKVLGTLLTLNYAAFWAAPVFVQGQAFRHGLARILRPLHRLADESPAWRRFAARYVYRRAEHTDYFAAAVFSAVATLGSVGLMFGWQIASGSLPWWLIAVYYFLWVGPGGRGMGTAYTLAHREGHLAGGKMYRPAIGARLGNVFENRLGIFYGIVPYTFSTSHILLHHRLNGGKGDPIYLWDLDRTKWGDLMLYQWRIFRWMAGIGSLVEFRRQSGVHPMIDKARANLRRGMMIYWIGAPAVILTVLVAAGSTVSSAVLFLFFVYLQPLLAMSTFLTVINVGQHGFMEIDAQGKLVTRVTAGTILDGPDDSFGEDYHFAHHYRPSVRQSGLRKQVLEDRSIHADLRGAVFEKITIFELAIMMQFGQFDRLIRRHYVDFAGDNDVDELADLFERRAKRREMSYEEYEFQYLPALRRRVQKLVRDGLCRDENQAYIYQAHRTQGSLVGKTSRSRASQAVR